MKISDDNSALSLPRKLWLTMLLIGLCCYGGGIYLIQAAYQTQDTVNRGALAAEYTSAMQNIVGGDLAPLFDNVMDEKTPMAYALTRYRSQRTKLRELSAKLSGSNDDIQRKYADVVVATRDLISVLDTLSASIAEGNLRKFSALWKNIGKPKLLEFSQSIPAYVNAETTTLTGVKDDTGGLVEAAFGAMIAMITLFFVLAVIYSDALLRALTAMLGSRPTSAPATGTDTGNEPDRAWMDALHAMQEVMVLADAHGRITHTNNNIGKITDITADKLLNTSYMDLLLDGCTEPRCGLTITLDTTGYGECIHKYQGRINDVRIYAINDRERSIDKKKVCVIRDITNMKEAEEALTDYTGRLQSSNRELQDFAYVASHDLQEPLRKIQTFAQRMQVKCKDQLNEQGQDYLARMTGAADRMQKLIYDLLVYSRVSTKAEPFTLVDLSKVVANVMSDLQVSIETTDARISVDALPVVEGDESQIQQLFQNLISNAIKFRKPDTTPELHIRLAPQNSAAPGNIPVHLVTNSCCLIIEDNGIGFDNKYTEKMFGMFQRLHGRSQYEGTGIGLAVCKKIVDRHRGTIKAIGEEGKGAKFVIQLPLTQHVQQHHGQQLPQAG